MPSSMTGFGRYEISDEYSKISVEIRSVNHRYLDLNLKLNHRLYPFEQKIRNQIGSVLCRGKVEVNIGYKSLCGVGEDIFYNEALAGMYLERINKISADFGLVNNLTAMQLAGQKDVLSLSETEVDEDKLFTLCTEALSEALNRIAKARAEEGERLSLDLEKKLNNLSDFVSVIEKKSPEIITAFRESLRKKVFELLGDGAIDEARISQEVVLYADKICVDEELVRIRSHIKAFEDALKESGEVGRKLDFITQEMNREANTILSKTIDAALSDTGIEIKTLIEKIREQIQNIE